MADLQGTMQKLHVVWWPMPILSLPPVQIWSSYALTCLTVDKWVNIC